MRSLRIAIVIWIDKAYHRRRRQAPRGRWTPVEYELIMPNRHLGAQPQLSPVVQQTLLGLSVTNCPRLEQ